RGDSCRWRSRTHIRHTRNACVSDARRRSSHWSCEWYAGRASKCGRGHRVGFGVLRLAELLSHPGSLPKAPHYFGEDVITARALHTGHSVDEVLILKGPLETRDNPFLTERHFASLLS